MAATLQRLAAYAEAGADVLFAPGLKTRQQIEEVVRIAKPLPVNVLVSPIPHFSMSDFQELGVRRLSVGSGLSRIAWGAIMDASQKFLGGSFEALANAATFGQLDELFRRAI